MGKVLDIKQHRPRCPRCGHYLDEHVIDPNDDAPAPVVRCRRVMEIKNGRIYYICGCEEVE
jgi:hypothetical protein